MTLLTGNAPSRRVSNARETALEYIYAALILHEADREISEKNVTDVLETANVDVEESRVKALVAALEDVDVEEAIAETAIGVPTPPLPPRQKNRRRRRRTRNPKKKKRPKMRTKTCRAKGSGSCSGRRV